MKTLLLFIFISLSSAQVDTVYHNNNMLQFDQMIFGKATYLVYMQGTEGKRSNFSLWKRSLSLNKKTQEINFHWLVESDPKGATWEVKTRLDANSFLAKEESSFYSKELIKSKDMRKHFRFLKNKMISSKDTSLHNTKAFEMPYSFKPFNWQLDMETFRLLPLAAGKSFAIPFYHPGSPSKPAFHIYSVIGSETLTLNGVNTDCWLLKTDYKNGNYGKWWINKKTHQVLKLEEKYGQRFRFKVLIEEDLF